MLENTITGVDSISCWCMAKGKFCVFATTNGYCSVTACAFPY